MDSPSRQVSVDGKTVDSAVNGVRSVSQMEEILVKVVSELMTTFDSLLQSSIGSYTCFIVSDLKCCSFRMDQELCATGKSIFDRDQHSYRV
jgi:glutamine synthetase type III